MIVTIIEGSTRYLGISRSEFPSFEKTREAFMTAFTDTSPNDTPSSLGMTKAST